MPARESTLSFMGALAVATREGRKTQTRRLLAPSKVFVDGRVVNRGRLEWTRLDWDAVRHHVPHVLHVKHRDGGEDGVSALTSRVIPGSRVMVKEPVTVLARGVFLYHEQPRPAGAPHPRAPRFMPHGAGRTLIAVDHVTFQRVRDITEDDALAEGVGSRAEFAELWRSMHGDEAWSTNPWVLAITYHLAERR